MTTTLVIKTSGGTAAWVTYFNSKAFVGYKYKISVQDKNHPNDTISINDVKSNIKFSYVQDQTVLVEHATDKSEWVLGNFSNGVITSGTTPLRLIHIAPTYCEK